MPEVALGFDFGLSRIGTAVGQTITGTASPTGIITAREGIPQWEEIDRLIRRWKPTVLLVGQPLNADDTVSEIAARAHQFALALAAHTGKSVTLVDERYSSRDARWRLEALYGNRQGFRRIDDLAATLIVETWLRSQ